jgi:hypothetical protein
VMMDGRPVAMIWSGWPVRQCRYFISVTSKLGELFGRDRLQSVSLYHCETRSRNLAPGFGSTDEMGTSQILSQNGSQKAHTPQKLPAVWLAIVELSLTQTSAVWASRRALDGPVCCSCPILILPPPMWSRPPGIGASVQADRDRQTSARR